MGMTNAPVTCFITDMPTVNKSSEFDGIEYTVDFNNKNYYFVFLRNHQNSEFVEKNKYILKGLLINEKIPFPKPTKFIDNDILEKIIIEAQIPRTPKNKLDNLILFLFDHQEFPGKEIDIKSGMNWIFILNKLYFKNQQEYWFYLNTLKDKGLINLIDTTGKIGSDAVNIKLTFQGLEFVINLQENSERSNNCFIAMSFSDTTIQIRETIKKTVRELGYDPLLVDELLYDSEMTINDAIISNIKKSKFLIADFTDQKHGVYFEVGFALGLKRPVIYTCLKKDFELTHFDINHYPHIVYNDLNDLEIRLKNKIQAWIE